MYEPARRSLRRARKRSRRAIGPQEGASREARADRSASPGQAGGPAGPGGRLTSFRDGLDLFPRTLADRLTRPPRLDTRVTALTHTPEGTWQVMIEEGEPLPADEVILALPAAPAARLLVDLDPGLAEGVRSIEAAPLAVVAMGFREECLGDLPDGFGFLVPRCAGLRILGCLRDSSIFPGRAPEGHALLRVMIGGAHDPGAVDLTDQELVGICLGELGQAAGVTGEPVFTRVIRHLGIPQYNLGHADRIQRIRDQLKRWPGLGVTGSSFHGVSINGCVRQAKVEASQSSLNLVGA